MSWFTRIVNALRPNRLDNDLSDEIRHHLESRAEDLEQQGLAPVEARRRAEHVFGNAARIREDSRDRRLSPALEAFSQDARFAWRGLLRNRVFSVTAILSLSVAIGANTAIYSIVDALLLRPLPVPEPHRLIALSTPESDLSGTFSYPLYTELGAAAGDLAALALFDMPNRVEAEANPQAPREEIVQQTVSENAFDVLRVHPAAGRLFSAEDRSPSSRPAAILSYDYWQRRFGGDPGVPGTTLTVNGKMYAIAGVTRQGFAGADPGAFIDIWTPVSAGDPGVLVNAGYRPFRVLGRLAPGVRRETLEARLQSAFHRHRLGEMTLQVGPGATGVSTLRRWFSRPLWILFGLAAGILLIACANVTTLLLARAVARSRETALRVSLGAGRGRLIRQLLTESLLIALLAGIGGWAIARVTAPLAPALLSTATGPLRIDLGIDARVVIFCLAACVLSAALFGSIPTWMASPADPILGLRGRDGLRARFGIGRLSVVLQIAFAFCLVAVGAGFLVSLRNLSRVSTGFDAHGVTVLTVTNDLGPSQRALQLALTWQTQTRVAALPGVQGAATAWMPMFTGARRSQRVQAPGRPLSDREELFYRVSPNYFNTLRTPLLVGRDFTTRDNDDEPVPTIVNTAFARRYFDADAPLGREFRRDDGVRHRIVGVASNSRYTGLRGAPEPIAYMPMKPPRAFTLYVRSTVDAASVAKLVEREARSLGSGMRVRDAVPLQTLIGNTIATEKLLARLGAAFASLGLFLAAIGVYGLVNYSVTRRTGEIGIRAALGASRLPLYGLVLGDLVGVLAVGLAVGLGGSTAILTVARSLLFDVGPVDPLVIGTAVAVLGGAAAIAGGLPALRIAAIDPIIALRHE